MLKAMLVGALLVGAGPAMAVASGGNNLPLPFYSNGFDTSVVKSVDDKMVTTYSDSKHYTSSVIASDPYFSLAVAASPTPYITAKAHGHDGVGSAGGGTIQYFFKVSGPTTQIIPLSAHIVIRAVVGGSAGSVEYTGGSVDIFTDLTEVLTSETASYGKAGLTPLPYVDLDENVMFTGTSNAHKLDTISVTGEATIMEALGQSGFAHLFVDPVITIDPIWAAAHPGYSLTFSPTIGNLANVTGTPEPATWVLLVGGFGAVGLAARRRQRSIAA